MQLPLFFEETLPGSGHFSLSENSSRHIVQVLRMRQEEKIQITNGNGYLITTEIISPDKKNTEVKIIDSIFISKQLPKIFIAVSYIKNIGRFEWFLEKAAEIGVAQIIPLICKRTEKTHLRSERMETILKSAMLQSRQVWLTKISEPVKIIDFVKSKTFDQKFIAHCLEGQKTDLKHSVSDEFLSKIILIGPEGDFTKEEIDAAIENGYLPVSLGFNRLRTETAALVAAVLLK